MSLRPFPCVVVLFPFTAEKTLSIKDSQLYLAEGCGQKGGGFFLYCFDAVKFAEMRNSH